MSKEASFLGRWSRLKQQARTDATEPAEPKDATEPAEPAIDLDSLPSLDSLDAASDYTPFLQAGVPAELRNQALRQAWVSDKAIAEFRGFAEYDWDFNAPGYGQLWAADKLAQLAAELGKTDEAEPVERTAFTVDAPATPEEPAVIAAPATPEAEEADAEAPASPTRSGPRRHGGAVPT